MLNQKSNLKNQNFGVIFSPRKSRFGLGLVLTEQVQCLSSRILTRYARSAGVQKSDYMLETLPNSNGKPVGLWRQSAGKVIKMSSAKNVSDEIEQILRNLDRDIKKVNDEPVPLHGTAFDLVQLYEPAIKAIKAVIDYRT